MHFTNDIPILQNTLTAIYADDTALLARHSNPRIARYRIQEHIFSLSEWLNKWKIKVNSTKSTAIYFTKAPVPRRPEELILENTILPWLDEVKYLGITLDQRLTYESHINNVATKIKKSSSALFPLLGKYSKLLPKYKLLLYKSIIRSKITYGSQIWGVAAPSLLYKLQSKQNMLVKQICNLPWYVRADKIQEEIKLAPIGNYIRSLAQKFYQNVPKVNNQLLQKMDDLARLNPCTGKRPRRTADLADAVVVKRRRRNPTPNTAASSSPFFSSPSNHQLNLTIGTPVGTRSLLSAPSNSSLSSLAQNTVSVCAPSYPPPIT